ncbi:MAG: hypothetical protein H6743_01400 [Rickettsiaceae bacterium]|nr:hypothetical protein [Rickettsiaceae bacterium]MCP5374746.1 hypothetical protein [Rickettsiaceae bacterium]
MIDEEYKKEVLEKNTESVLIIDEAVGEIRHSISQQELYELIGKSKLVVKNYEIVFYQFLEGLRLTAKHDGEGGEEYATYPQELGENTELVPIIDEAEESSLTFIPQTTLCKLISESKLVIRNSQIVCEGLFNKLLQSSELTFRSIAQEHKSEDSHKYKTLGKLSEDSIKLELVKFNLNNCMKFLLIKDAVFNKSNIKQAILSMLPELEREDTELVKSFSLYKDLLMTITIDVLKLEGLRNIRTTASEIVDTLKELNKVSSVDITTFPEVTYYIFNYILSVCKDEDGAFEYFESLPYLLQDKVTATVLKNETELTPGARKGKQVYSELVLSPAPEMYSAVIVELMGQDYPEYKDYSSGIVEPENICGSCVIL